MIIFQQVPDPPAARKEEAGSSNIETKDGGDFDAHNGLKDFMKQEIQGESISPSDRVVVLRVELLDVVRLIGREDLIL